MEIFVAFRYMKKNKFYYQKYICNANTVVILQKNSKLYLLKGQVAIYDRETFVQNEKNQPPQQTSIGKRRDCRMGMNSKEKVAFSYSCGKTKMMARGVFYIFCNSNLQ